MNGERPNQTYYTGDGVDKNDWGPENYESFEPRGELREEMYDKQASRLDTPEGFGSYGEELTVHEYLGRLNADLEMLASVQEKLHRDINDLVRRESMRSRGVLSRGATPLKPRPEASGNASHSEGQDAAGDTVTDTGTNDGPKNPEQQ